MLPGPCPLWNYGQAGQLAARAAGADPAAAAGSQRKPLRLRCAVAFCPHRMKRNLFFFFFFLFSFFIFLLFI